MKAVRFVLEYAKGNMIPLALTVGSMVLLVGLQLLSPWIIRTMIATVTDPEAGAEALDQISRLALLALAIYAVRGILRFLRSYMAHVAGWNVVADVRSDIYQHLQRLSLRFYEDKQTGQLMSRTVNDSDLIERLIAHAIPDVMVNLLMLIGVTLVLMIMNWRLALLSMIPIPMIVIAMRGFAKYVRPAFRVRQRELGDLNATLNDNLSGIREIKAFTREQVEAANVRDHIVLYRDSMLRALRLMATFHPFVEFASALGTIVLILFGGRLVLNQTMPIEDLVAFFLYLEMLYQPVRVLSQAWEGVQEATAGVERVVELMDEQPDVVERPDAIELPGRAEGGIVLSDVDFRYTQGDMVLEGIDLDIAPGSVVALVGPTGVGKTTMANLIPRFYDVREGSITLDGIDIRDLTLKSLRQQISIVLQDVFLFHGTARDNISFGRPGATEEEIVEAARVANAHEFVTQLPQGYDTTVGERGTTLSGGQVQRIAIARAILKDPDILIFDEATSHVDDESERAIRRGIDDFFKSKTRIIESADRIFVLEKGSIARSGTFAELFPGGRSEPMPPGETTPG